MFKRFKKVQDFLCIPSSAADASTVNTNGFKTFLANDLSTFYIKDIVVSNSSKSYWSFSHYIFYKSFTKLRDLTISLKWCMGKKVSLLDSAIRSGERFEVTSVPFFILDFNLCK